MKIIDYLARAPFVAAAFSSCSCSGRVLSFTNHQRQKTKDNKEIIMKSSNTWHLTSGRLLLLTASILLSSLLITTPLFAFTASDLTADVHNTFSTALGDVDGDGDLDLIAGNYGSANRLYLNDGSGNFDAGSNITADAHRTLSTTLGDIDGDGDLDLITGNDGINRLYLKKNRVEKPGQRAIVSNIVFNHFFVGIA